MKIIIGVILIYILLVTVSSVLMKYIISPFVGTEHEESWLKTIKDFSLGYLIAMVLIAIVISIFNFCF